MREGKRRHRVVRNLRDDDWRAARKLVKELGRVFRPLEALFQSSAKSALCTIAKAHVEAAQALATPGSDGQAGSLWQGEAGEQAVQVFRHPARRQRACAGHGRGRLSRVLPQPRRRRERPPARGRASAHRHLGALRVAPAAARRGDPRLAQRGHLAAGRRPRPLAQPADAGRRSACRRRRSASAMPRTSSRRCWASARSTSRARPRSTACRRCRRAGCCGCRRCSPASATRRSPTSRGSPGRRRAMRSTARSGPCVRPSRARRSLSGRASSA